MKNPNPIRKATSGIFSVSPNRYKGRKEVLFSSLAFNFSWGVRFSPYPLRQRIICLDSCFLIRFVLLFNRRIVMLAILITLSSAF